MSQAVREPKQERSKETLHRLMEAAEKLMSERPFEKITLQQLVTEAKTTTGRFYARFSDKYAMLAALFEEHMNHVNEKVRKTLKELPSQEPQERIARIVEVVGAAFQMRPALMRSGTLLFWNRAKGEDQLPAPMAPKMDLLRSLRQTLQDTAVELGAKDAKLSSMFALKIILSASRHHYLFTDDRTVLKTNDATFQRELTQMVYTYLGAGDPS